MKEIKTVRAKIENGEAKPDFTAHKNARLMDTATDGHYVYYTFEYEIDEKPKEESNWGKSKLG